MENGESLQNICDQMMALAQKASMLASALENQDEATKKYAEKCHRLAKRLSSIRSMLVEEYGESAKGVRTTTLIKRLIEERNNCQRQLATIAQEVQDENIVSDERNANAKTILANILSQSTDKQLSDWASLRTYAGQNALIKRQREQIKSLEGENLSLRGEIMACQAKAAFATVQAQKHDCQQSGQISEYEAQIQDITSQRDTLQNELEFVTTRERLSAEAHEYEVEQLNKRIAELEAQLKNSGRFKLSLAIKNFALKIKSIFTHKTAEVEESERV